MVPLAHSPRAALVNLNPWMTSCMQGTLLLAVQSAMYHPTSVTKAAGEANPVNFFPPDLGF